MKLWHSLHCNREDYFYCSTCDVLDITKEAHGCKYRYKRKYVFFIDIDTRTVYFDPKDNDSSGYCMGFLDNEKQ
jgi:hypothetical protein